MATSTGRNFWIGLFVLTGFVLFALGCVLFGGGNLFKQKVYFETYFEDSVQGLDVGGPVKFRGVKVGAIESLGFASATYGEEIPEEAIDTEAAKRALNLVRVLCSIDASHFPNLEEEKLRAMTERPKGLRTSLALQGITGVVYINLDYEKKPSPSPQILWETDTLHIPSTPTSLQQMMSAAETIAERLPEAINSLTSLATTMSRMVENANIPRLTEEFSKLAQTLNTQANHLAELVDAIDPTELGDQVRAMAKDLSAAVNSLRQEIPELSNSINTTLRSTQHSLARTEQSLEKADELMVEITELTKDVHQEVNARDLGESLRALTRTTATLEAFIQELREQPSRLIFDDPLN